MENNKTLSDYFKNIYCVNLESRPDRWLSTQKELDKFDIKNVIRFNAVDGSKMSEFCPTNLLTGELGIILSHLELIKHAKTNNLENIVIIEDDIYFSTEILKLEEYMCNVPDDWDFIYLGANHYYNGDPNFITPNVIKLKHSFGLQCVVIKNTMYDKIIEELPKLKTQVDVTYANWMIDNNTYCFYPNVALQREDFSDIQGRVVNYDCYFKNF